jgi:hypothetical protein
MTAIQQSPTVVGTLMALVVCSAAVAQGVPEQRVPIDQFKWSQPGGGSAMVPGQQTVFVVGDGKSNGLFSLVFKVPANSKIQPHSHPEERSCFVLSGMWYFRAPRTMALSSGRPPLRRDRHFSLLIWRE